jgi:hypothetical protein
MALDLNTELAVQLDITGDAATRRAVSRLLLQVVHDVNGRLGTAVLRAASVDRGLGRLSGELHDHASEATRADLARTSQAHAALLESLADLNNLIAGLSEAAWVLEEGAENP